MTAPTLRSLRTHADHQTDMRTKALETVNFCEAVSADRVYSGPYRPDADLVRIADDALHNLMGYRSEHSDPLAF